MPAGPALSAEELNRYARQLVIPEIGRSGQARLKKAKVLIVGTGGLGSAIAMYLAAAGVGRLGLVDSDVVERSNLQRQLLHSAADLGRPKTDSARDAIRRINPHVRVDTFQMRFIPANARRILKPYGIVVDGTDNFATRFAINRAAVALGRPYVFGSVFRLEGQTSVFDARRGPCYECLYPAAPTSDLVPDATTAGVLGVLPGIIGLIEATETIKLILGAGDPLVGRLLVLNALSMDFRELRIRKDPGCGACGGRARRSTGTSSRRRSG
jgi:sulfur-carrier protein adenylyltransferase/sulfurtransferase